MILASLKILYTNADQFLKRFMIRKHSLLAMNLHDLMLISEILPKNRSVFVNAGSLMISDYTL